MTSPLENEFMKCWSELTPDEKESLLNIAKNYMQLRKDHADEPEIQILKEDPEKYLSAENKSFAWNETKELTFRVPKELNEKDIKLLIAGMLYEKAIFSSGQAAEYAGIKKREFIETIGQYGFSIFNYAPSELARDINNA
jgi:predicted HTH domain antitoxin